MECVGEYGGGRITTAKKEYNSNASITLNNPTPDSTHYFKGWAISENSSDCVYPVKSFTAGYALIPAAAPSVYDTDMDAYLLRLYPVWGELITVNYVDDLHSANYSELVNPEQFTSKNVTESGYRMTWNTQADGSGTSYNRNSTITNITQQAEYDSENKSITLYSRWEKKLRYTFLYRDTDGNTIRSDSTDTSYCRWDDYDYVFPISSLSLTGYTFLEYRDSTGTPVTSFKASDFTSVSGDFFMINITAVFEEKVYNITVRLNCTDASGLPSEKTYTYKYTDIKNSSSFDIGDPGDPVSGYWPTRNGMVFVGWYLYDSDGNYKTKVTQQNGKFSVSSIKDSGPTFILMDQWNVKYSITPVVNNSDSSSTLTAVSGTKNSIYAPDGSAYLIAELSIPSAGGYSFKGYSLTANAASADVCYNNNTTKVSIPLENLTPPDNADGSFTATVYGQWTKKIKTGFITSITSPGNSVNNNVWKTDPDGGYNYYTEVWLSSITNESKFSFTPPSETPTSNYYSFGGWNTVPKIKGQSQGVENITELPLNSYTNLVSGIFYSYVYAIWQPKNAYFKYKPLYEIDNVISDDNALSSTISNFPDDYNPDTGIVTRDYDTLFSAGGFQLAPLSARGYQFLGWYVNNTGTNEDKGVSQNSDYLIESNGSNRWVEQIFSEGSNNTFVIQARWHMYNKYTFLYNRNEADLVTQMTQNVTNPDTGEQETVVIQTFTGEYLSTTDPILSSLDTDAQSNWKDIFFEDDIPDRTVNSNYIKISEGNMTAIGYVFDGWSCTYYTVKNAATSSETQTYDSVVYGKKGTRSYSISDCQNSGFYKPWVDTSDGNVLAIFTARWVPYFGAVFDKNVPAAAEESVTAFPELNTQVYKKDNFTTSKVFTPETAPARTGYKFYGWSLDPTVDPKTDKDANTKLLNSNAYVNRANVPRKNCTEVETGCFRARVYAIWEPLYTYTFIYSINRPGLAQEGYPQGSYLGKDDDSLDDSTWNGTDEEWTEIYDELFMNDDANAARFYDYSGSYRFRVRTGLLKSDQYIFRGWTAKTYQRNLNSTQTDPEKYYTVGDDKLFPGKYDLKQTQTITLSDIANETNNGGIFGSYLKNNNQNVPPKPAVIVLTAIWEPHLSYVIKYNSSIGTDGAPSETDFLSINDSVAENDGLSALPTNADGEWLDIIDAETIDSCFVNNYYPLKHNKLQAMGYKFIGWNMYYNMKDSSSPSGRRRVGPYSYRINNSGGFGDKYGIYKGWFNSTRCVDMQFDLYAVWEPQYQAYFHKGVDSEHAAEISNMPPEPGHDDLVPYYKFKGDTTRVFPASAPTRSNYYFIGWSTRSDLDVDGNPDDINYVLRRNSKGPSVPKSAFVTLQHNEVDQGYFRADLYAVWSQKPVYSIFFDENADDEAYPNIEYTGAVAGKTLPDPWIVQLTQEQTGALDKYYYFDKNNVLAAKGYKFIGWDHGTDTETAGSKPSAVLRPPITESKRAASLKAYVRNHSSLFPPDGNRSIKYSSTTTAAALLNRVPSSRE